MAIDNGENGPLAPTVFTSNHSEDGGRDSSSGIGMYLAIAIILVCVVVGVWILVVNVDDTGYPDEKRGDGVARNDLEPLTSRFSGLSEATAATWYSGWMGDDRLPGPSTMWIDAVVTMPSETTEDLRASYSLVASSDKPDVVPQLSAALPSVEFGVSEYLNNDWSDQTWQVQVFVSMSTPQVVILAVAYP